ncbi:MAG TPA: glycosyltransferase family 2 protein [Phycisphaerales bacterium]|nr:glycosyltransferase family 2 protein [Phycisphaerales bacterium]|tara:strand:- start:60074 stop:60814 length:741 start_codon:yes stop_codon:yes gene_type:complete
MRILIAIPVYNEERYVTKVLEQVRHYSSDILVIDDGSTDQTPMLLAQQPVDVIRHAVNRGYGQSMGDAFRWSSCYGYDWVITMDCDEQHEPASLPMFFDAIKKDDADIISGSRYMSDSRSEDLPPADRRHINQIITKQVNEVLDLKLTDGFCGFKAYRVSAMNKLKLTEQGYAFPLQFWVQAVANELVIREVPISLIYNDPNRSFGGPLNDAEKRLEHYRQVFAKELKQHADRFGCADLCSCNGHS